MTACPKLGLVFGGGGVRGAAHVGAMSVFERVLVRPQVIVGTSIGAVVGAPVAAGVSSEALLQWALALKWPAIMRPAPRPRLGAFDTSALGEGVQKLAGVDNIEDLPIPFAAIACDIHTGATLTLTEGSIAEAVIASSAIPGLFKPVVRDDRLLVDGGLTDNLPTLAARMMGADFVIAIDVMPAPDGVFVPESIRDALMLSWSIATRHGELGRAYADVVVTPDVASVSMIDLTRIADAYQAGMVAAERVLNSIPETYRTTM